MAKKYYAVRTGRNPGIYRTWDQCKKQVMGYPAAQYKGFATEEEAQAFMNGGETRTAGGQAGNGGGAQSGNACALEEAATGDVVGGANLGHVDLSLRSVVCKVPFRPCWVHYPRIAGHPAST